jgi:glutaredoxin
MVSRLVGLLCFVVALGSSVVVFADIYRYVGEDGTVYYTDKPADKQTANRVTLQINSFTAPKVEPFRFDPALVTPRSSAAAVTLYSTTWCGYCKQARRYFERNSIAFEEYDVETSARGKADYKAMKGRGVPIILVGEQRMNGFSPDSFERLYRR